MVTLPFLAAAAIGAGGAMVATSLFNKPKMPSAPALPTTPSPGASLQKAQQESIQRLRMVASTGGKTTYAGSAQLDPSNLQMKTLLG